MTKFSFLTVFFSVHVSAAKMPYLLPRGAISAMPTHSLPTIHLPMRHHDNKQIWGVKHMAYAPLK